MKFLQSLQTLMRKIESLPLAAEILAVLAGFLAAYQGFTFAHTQNVTMDEGTYLMKGLLFVEGVYQPFQDFGPLTNKMPLAFYIPGLAQAWFGPGLRTGRYFSIALMLLMLLGLWIVTRRLSERWWAAGVVWAVAANAANLTYYSLATSQVIIICLMVWMFTLSLGEQRRLWETTLAALLAALAVLTRQNMAPLVPLVVLFIFWQHGRKAGLFALLTSAAALLLVHAIFWPNILEIWSPWVPGFIKSIINSLVDASMGGGKSTSRIGYDWLPRIDVFFEGFRFNFLALMGSVCAWICWPRKRDWDSPSDFRAGVFLSVTLIILWAAHLWAALFKDYCLYCYSGYLAFFSIIGLVLTALTFRYWRRARGLWRQLLAGAWVLIASTGIGYSAFHELAPFVMNLPVPRMRNMRILPGTTRLWQLLSNKFGWTADFLQQVLPTAAGLAFGAALLAVCVLVFFRLRRRKTSMQPGLAALFIMIGLGTLLTPIKVFGGGKYAIICGWDVIASHEAAGEHLAKLIKPGSLVYWQNDVSPLPLLYIPGVRVFTPQLNHWYTYLEGGDAQKVYKNGYWNAELAAQWKTEADYLLIADKYIGKAYQSEEFVQQFDELAPSPAVMPCQGRSIIHIFQRVQ